LEAGPFRLHALRPHSLRTDSFVGEVAILLATRQLAHLAIYLICSQFMAIIFGLDFAECLATVTDSAFSTPTPEVTHVKADEMNVQGLQFMINARNHVFCLPDT
jgi:hypothetical protein